MPKADGPWMPNDVTEWMSEVNALANNQDALVVSRDAWAGDKLRKTWRSTQEPNDGLKWMLEVNALTRCPGVGMPGYGNRECPISERKVIAKAAYMYW